jgi:hypothetical protein
MFFIRQSGGADCKLTYMKQYPIIAWWSGGITSAVACKLALRERWVRVIFINTGNEDADTYRFKADCEAWYGVKIEEIRNERYQNIQEVWRRYKSLNVANGAVCSTDLKRKVREDFQKVNSYRGQVFGFEIEETNRARAMKKNYPEAKPMFPLINELLTKRECLGIIQQACIAPPRVYALGFNNNNCFQTGCVQGGIGYWQKIRDEFPEKFEAMAAMEHELTEAAGKPVTMLKDQSKHKGLVFLKPHPLYPLMKDLSMMKGRPPKPLMECNGFCGINDLSVKNETENEINFSLY